MYTLEQLQKKSLTELKEIGWALNILPAEDRRRRQNWIDALVNVNPPLLQLLEVSTEVEVDAQDSIRETVEPSPAAESEQVQELPIDSKFGHIVYPKPSQKPNGNKTDKTGTYRLRAGSAELHNPGNIDTAESDASSQGFKCEVDRCQIRDQLLAISGDSERVWRSALLHQPTELTANDEQHPNRSDDSRDRLENEPRMSQSAIAPAAKNYLNDESDQNPILTGIPLSDRFVTRYTPPQIEIIHFESDTDGQLSLLDFEVESVEEPPDPDDIESLDEFHKAIALWDAQNLEPLAVSMDSMCEWAPCPQEWYEPESGILSLKVSSVRELSPPAIECSITSENFTIPTFGAWCDRANRQIDTDEPPDTGIFARLPKPKPPKSPQAASWTFGHKAATSERGIPKLSRNYPETIPKLFHRVAADSILPARSPPGGDAMSE
jgi:hypothetical protein